MIIWNPFHLPASQFFYILSTHSLNFQFFTLPINFDYHSSQNKCLYVFVTRQIQGLVLHLYKKLIATTDKICRAFSSVIYKMWKRSPSTHLLLATKVGRLKGENTFAITHFLVVLPKVQRQYTLKKNRERKTVDSIINEEAQQNINKTVCLKNLSTHVK